MQGTTSRVENMCFKMQQLYCSGLGFRDQGSYECNLINLTTLNPVQWQQPISRISLLFRENAECSSTNDEAIEETLGERGARNAPVQPVETRNWFAPCHSSAKLLTG
jgi:hypothetical protein